MEQIAELRRRLLAARDDFRAIPSGGENRLGAPNPATGEAWSRGHVLGHMADILIFWSGQLRLALEGQSWIGRGDAGYENRRAAIMEGVSGDEAALRERIEKGVDQVLVLLDSVRPEDLGRTVEHRRSVETRVKTIGHLLDEVLVGHFEAHVKQLAELS